MFSAITISRTLLRLAVLVPGVGSAALVRRAAHPRGEPRLMFDIVGRRGWWYLLSTVLLVPGVVALLTGGLKPGIDFTGGTLLQVRVAAETTQEDVTSAAQGAGFPEAVVQMAGESDALLRVRAIDIDEKDDLLTGLGSAMGPVEELGFSAIGPVVGEELTRAAIIAVAVASGLILLYVTWAFRGMQHSFRYGVAAIVALLHDALFVLACSRSWPRAQRADRRAVRDGPAHGYWILRQRLDRRLRPHSRNEPRLRASGRPRAARHPQHHQPQRQPEPHALAQYLIHGAPGVLALLLLGGRRFATSCWRCPWDSPAGRTRQSSTRRAWSLRGRGATFHAFGAG